MKKGFTLVELIAVIVLIGVIGLLVVPVINNTIKNNKEKLFNNQIKEIENATLKWAYLNTELLPKEENGVASITISELKKEGLLPLDIRDPRNDTLISNETIITITYKNNNYDITVDKENITNDNTIYNENGPILVLNGNNIEYVEINNTYEELGAIAKDANGNNLDVSIQYLYNSNEVGTIDTTDYKTFSVVYSASNTINGEVVTSKIVRTVIVRDTTEPVITVPENTVIEYEKINDFDIMEGVTVTDNSLETISIIYAGFNTQVGKQIVSYTGCDSHNNCATKKRIITIVE